MNSLLVVVVTLISLAAYAFVINDLQLSAKSLRWIAFVELVIAILLQSSGLGRSVVGVCFGFLSLATLFASFFVPKR